LVVKPDQLIKRRGKLGLLGLNLDWYGVKKWISERAGTVTKVISACFEFSVPLNYVM
jgi:ATP citrate (pro-S)-lyase